MAIEEFRHRTPQKEKPRCLRNLRWYFMEYCNSTSIHGFKYLGERRSTIEKLWWAIVITTSFYYCISMVVETYQKWERSPVIVSFATSETPIWEIPFPAVTICPRTKAIKRKFNFTEMALLNNNNTEMDAELAVKWQKFEYMSLVCSSKLNLFSDRKPLDKTGPEVLNFLMGVQPKFNDTVMDFNWVGEQYFGDIYKLFKPIITSDGVCYTFNMLDREEIFTKHMAKNYYKTFGVTHHPPSQWSIEKGYKKDAGLDTFPRRTLVSGTDGGVDLILVTPESDLDYICGDALQGYKVILHHPAKMPNPKQGYFRIGLNQDVAAAVRPNIMKTSSELKRYEPQNRNCYLTKEKNLRFFKIYNQQDCLFECLTNFTRKYCQCVGFYMPRDKSTPICGPYKQSCIEIANSRFLSSEVSFKIEHPEQKTPRNISQESYQQDCNCLPSCDALDFDSEVTMSDWGWHKGRTIVAPKNESESYHLSRLRIFFKDMQFITSQRNELYGQTDFWANCGGLLGLFTGFSLISLVEIIYFATLRFACNFRKLGRDQWSGAEELMIKRDDDN